MATRGHRGAAPVASIRRRRRMNATLLVSTITAGMLFGSIVPAAAQEAPTVPEGAEKLEVEQTAFYEYPYYTATPNTAVAEFPPGVFCLVAPGAPVCQPNPASEGVEGALGAVQEGEPASPESPVPPDTLPASLVNGEKRYVSAVKFTLPTVPAGEEVAQFTLVLDETQPTYHSSSPAFRRAVLGALSCVRGCDPAEEFRATLATAPVESAVIDVEVCPLAEPFKEGRSQPSEAIPEVNELYCSTAVRADSGQWIVDLMFAGLAWTSGEIPNHGVLIRPTGAPNLAYGDPDATTQAQVTYTEEILAATSTTPAAEEPPAFDDSGSFGGDPSSGGFVDSGGFSADSGGFSSTPSGGGSGFSSDPFSTPAQVDVDQGTAAPEVAPDDLGATDGAAAPVAGPATEPAAAGGAWWLWLLVPIFAAGSWTTARSLAAEPVVAMGAISRNGAMTRLIERNRTGSPGIPMTQV